jgi:prevent-host-death family protein
MEAEASKIRQSFAAYLEMAHEGNEITILKHGKPEAKLIGIKIKPKQADDIEDFFSMRVDDQEDGTNYVNRIRSKRRW